jgi:hypothetical protein
MQLDNVVLSEALQGQPIVAERVAAQRGVVAEEIDLATARAEWDLRPDEHGRDLLVLRVQDPLGAEAQSAFAPVELENEGHLRSRLHDLLGAALRINRWRQNLVALYQKVQAWVGEDRPAAFVRENAVTLDEERSGPYHVAALEIAAGGRSARLEPIAAWVVGADGRVDLVGPGGREVFVVDDRRGWFWVGDRQPNRLQTLTSQLFVQLLDGVLQ